MAKQEIIDNMQELLANSYGLYLKTQNYHWNVRGANFTSLHKMFEEQYEELAGAVDNIAERIRAMGSLVPASFKVFDKASSIKDGNESNAWPIMIEDLLDGHKLIQKQLLQIIEVAAKNNDKITEDFAISRKSIHDEAIWMLQSTLEK